MLARRVLGCTDRYPYLNDAVWNQCTHLLYGKGSSDSYVMEHITGSEIALPTGVSFDDNDLVFDGSSTAYFNLGSKPGVPAVTMFVCFEPQLPIETDLRLCGMQRSLIGYAHFVIWLDVGGSGPSIGVTNYANDESIGEDAGVLFTGGVQSASSSFEEGVGFFSYVDGVPYDVAGGSTFSSETNSCDFKDFYLGKLESLGPPYKGKVKLFALFDRLLSSEDQAKLHKIALEG